MSNETYVLNVNLAQLQMLAEMTTKNAVSGPSAREFADLYDAVQFGLKWMNVKAAAAETSVPDKAPVEG